MPGRIRAVVFVGVIIGALVLSAVAAHAAEWYPPVIDGSMLLGFGARYAGGTHRGVDISAAPGSGVAAPAAGTVVFAGHVPADGGGTCKAVTVELPDGRRLSLLPLESVSVVAGETIEAGREIGQVAAAGDDSSAAPHVHVSLRSGELYLDPGDLLGAGAGSDVAAPVTTAPVTEVPNDTAGGTGFPIPGQFAAHAASPTPALAEPRPVASNVMDAVAPGATAIPAVMRMQEVQCSGVPQPSTLVPSHWRGTARDTPIIAPLDSRVVTGTGLACAMVAAAIGIGLSRRAAAVRVN